MLSAIGRLVLHWQEANLEQGDLILLTLRKRGGEGPPLLYNGEELSIKVWSGREKTVAHLILGVARELGVNPEQILLSLDSGPLLDGNLHLPSEYFP